MKEFTLHGELWVPAPRDRVFEFCADARNLEANTPPWLRFGINNEFPIEMKVGTLINYQLRVHGIPLRWQSVVTAWETPHRFVDEQRRGPYRRWIHEHRFEESNGGTLWFYAVLGGWLIQRIFVRRDVEAILNFRREKLLRLFPG